jgi:hypothetical protein
LNTATCFEKLSAADLEALDWIKLSSATTLLLSASLDSWEIDAPALVFKRALPYIPYN